MTSGRAADAVADAAWLLSRLLVIAIVLILSAQVFCRFVLNQSLIWSEEVATWCLVWIVYAGSVALMRHREHVAIPIFVRLLPPGLHAAAIILRGVAVVLCLGFVAWYGTALVSATMHITSQATGINTRWVKLCIPASMALMTALALDQVVRDVMTWAGGGSGALILEDTAAITDVTSAEPGPARS